MGCLKDYRLPPKNVLICILILWSLPITALADSKSRDGKTDEEGASFAERDVSPDSGTPDASPQREDRAKPEIIEEEKADTSRPATTTGSSPASPAQIHLTPAQPTGAPQKPAVVTDARQNDAANSPATPRPSKEDAAGDFPAATGETSDAKSGKEGPKGSKMSPKMTAVWSLVSGCGVALITGGAFGMAALEERTRYDHTTHPDFGDRVRARAIASDVFLGVGAVSAALALIVFFVVDDDQGKEKKLGFYTGPGRASLRLTF